MILYLDTSSLVKLYIREDGSKQVRELVDEAISVTTCRIACPEFYSALTRRLNNNEIAGDDYQLLCALFNDDWNRLYALDFDEMEAGRLVCNYGLRGADALHLSSALMLARKDDTLETVFSSADRKLNQAARKEGLRFHAR